MEAPLELQQDNPLKKANFISRLFFSWITPLSLKCCKHGVGLVDLYKPLDKDCTTKLADQFEVLWQQELKKPNPCLLRALIRMFAPSYIWSILAVFINTIVIWSMRPLCLLYFIKKLDQTDPNRNDLYIASFLLVLSTLLNSFFYHHCMQSTTIISMRLKASISSILYRKVLRLNHLAMGQVTIGSLVNLVSNEMLGLDIVLNYMPYTCVIPFYMIVTIYLMWQVVGLATLAGVVPLTLFSVILQGSLSKIFSMLRSKVAHWTDERVKTMSELIAGMQVLKLYAWERPYSRIVTVLRNKQLFYLGKVVHIRAFNLSSIVFLERIATFFTIVTYIMLGHTLTPAVLFSIAQFYNCLQLIVTAYFPITIAWGSETASTLKRIQQILELPELENKKVPTSLLGDRIKKGLVQFRSVSATWTDSTKLNLFSIDLQVSAGQLCVIIGPVGSGKSTLLQLILNELPECAGFLNVTGSVVYASQEPWLFTGSVRQNILFGQPFNRIRYKQVVRVCALQKDLDQLPYGDKTVVGDRGVGLSGGQRARINLARAIYRESDIYLMDDPLSAVDAQVSQHLFEECIAKFLSGKTRILVTHQLQHLKRADLIVVLNQGRIEAKGTFEQLLEANLDFKQFVGEPKETNCTTNEVPLKIAHRRLSARTSSVASSFRSVSNAPHIQDSEEDQIHFASNSSFRKYVLAMGNLWVLSALILYLIFTQFVCIVNDIFLAQWAFSARYIRTNQTSTTSFVHWFQVQQHPNATLSTKYPVLKIDTAIYIYVALLICVIVTVTGRAFFIYALCLRAARRLHKRMFEAILRTPIKFFDTNPAGRILNRFSKDLAAADELLPRSIVDSFQTNFVTLGVMVMAVSLDYMLIIVAVLCIIAIWFIFKWYVKVCWNLEHLDGIAKSPILSHLASTMCDLTTIRALGNQEILRKQFDEKLDVHSASSFWTTSCTHGFGLWVDIIFSSYSLGICLTFLLTEQYKTMDSNIIGLILSQSLILNHMVQYGIAQTVEACGRFTSVNRILQYVDLKPECAAEKVVAPKRWPLVGRIHFDHLYLKYDEEEDVLKDIDLVIEAGQHVGIVGRTGAGKSSLIAAIFRLVQPHRGRILIDSTDTNSLDLNQLRSKISIIPQVPVIFTATVRQNLDPFGQADDAQLWEAIKSVELENVIDNLDMILLDGGSSLSVGQRQLLCLARVTLRQDKILILDEATANVDPSTDLLIQKTIREQFRNRTVLTIAHRLNTIMDSDKVLVMDSGTVIEYDHPAVLLDNVQGHFYQMVQQIEPVMAQQLINIAREHFRKTNDHTNF